MNTLVLLINKRIREVQYLMRQYQGTSAERLYREELDELEGLRVLHGDRDEVQEIRQ